MSHTRWSPRAKDHSGTVHDESGAMVASFRGDTTAIVGDAQWELKKTDTGLQACLPDGRVLRAHTTGPLKRAKRVEVDLDGTTVIAVNEARQDWVYVDATDNKVGQFSGGNNGVRAAITEFEVPLPVEHTVFLSWVTRTLLEARLGSSTTAMLAVLIIMLIVAVVTLI